ncbi:IS3 family transposase [[Ruminococcus] lactaris]|uniref:IS3 family transposase n=1 Tax=[Ruminococcus] lactaris TaxID=46228 RepID=UPI0032C066FF
MVPQLQIRRSIPYSICHIREAHKAIGKYIHTYNFERCHSAINNQTPASYYYPALLIDYAA